MGAAGQRLLSRAPIGACTLVLVACGGLPTGERIDDGPVVRRKLSQILGTEFHLAPPVRLPTGITNQAFSYYGATPKEMILVVVFDRPKSVNTALGPHAVSAGKRTRVVQYRNVIVFYTLDSPAPDRSGLILSALRGVV
jgi:hypothetical protein